MAFYSMFKHSARQTLQKIDVLKLQPNDLCYYEKFKEPFKVTEVATTSRGVFYVEIAHPRTKRTFVFTDFFPVLVPEDIFRVRN